MSIYNHQQIIGFGRTCPRPHCRCLQEGRRPPHQWARVCPATGSYNLNEGYCLKRNFHTECHKSCGFEKVGGPKRQYIVTDTYICNGGSLLVEGIVKGVVLLLQSINLLVELGLQIGRIQLQLFQCFHPTSHLTHQKVKNIIFDLQKREHQPCREES